MRNFKRSTIQKMSTVFLTAAFLLMSAGPVEALAPSLLSDAGIDPARSREGKNRVGKKLFPGAIGNGDPLFDLMAGVLPAREKISDNPLERDILKKISEAAELAAKLHITHRDRIPGEYRDRTDRTLENLIRIRTYPEKAVYFFRSVVISEEDYLLGFNTYEKPFPRIGLAYDLADRLYGISVKRLAQYIYHECVQEKIMPGREDHRTLYSEIQPAIFGREEVVALGNDLRAFIFDVLKNREGKHVSRRRARDAMRENDRSHEWMFNLLRMMVSGDGKALAVEVGSGKDMVALENAGFQEVHGVCSSGIDHEKALRRGLPASRVFHLDVTAREIPGTEGGYDLVWGGDMSEIFRKDRTYGVIEKMKKALSVDGIIAFKLPESIEDPAPDDIYPITPDVNPLVSIRANLLAYDMREIYVKKVSETVSTGTGDEAKRNYWYVVARPFAGDEKMIKPPSDRMIRAIISSEFDEYGYSEVAGKNDLLNKMFRCISSGNLDGIIPEVEDLHSGNIGDIDDLISNLEEVRQRYIAMSEENKEALRLVLLMRHIADLFPHQQGGRPEELTSRLRVFLNDLSANSMTSMKVLQALMNRDIYTSYGIRSMPLDISNLSEDVKDILYLLSVCEILSFPGSHESVSEKISEMTNLRRYGPEYYENGDDGLFSHRMRKLTGDLASPGIILSNLEHMQGGSRLDFILKWSEYIRLRERETFQLMYDMSPGFAATFMNYIHNEINLTFSTLGLPMMNNFSRQTYFETDISFASLDDEMRREAMKKILNILDSGKEMPMSVFHRDGRFTLVLRLKELLSMSPGDAPKKEQTSRKEKEPEELPFGQDPDIPAETEIEYRIEVLKTVLFQALSADRSARYIVAVDDEIGGVHNESLMMPIKIALEGMASLRGRDGEPLFPNLTLVRGRGGEPGKGPAGPGFSLGERIDDAVKAGNVPMEKVFILTTQTGLEAGNFSRYRGRSWMVGLSDEWCSEGGFHHGYIPVFESISVALMGYLGASPASIAGYLNTISHDRIDPASVEKMLTERLFMILPKMLKMPAAQLRDVYECFRRIVFSA